MRVAAIVPAFNEARNLPRLAEALLAHAPAVEVCLVDDGSSDETAQVAAGLGWTVLRLPMNLGIGGAVQAGYLWALERGHDVAVQIDGDGQHDPAFLEALLAPIREDRADVVIGSRFLSEGGFRSTLVRRAGIRYLCWFLRLRCGVRISDPTSGFRAAGRAAIALFARYYPSDYPEPEAVALARRAGLRVAEAPVRMHERAHGRSSITALRSLYYLVKVSLALVLLPHRPVALARERIALTSPDRILPIQIQLLSIAVLLAFTAWVVWLIRTQRLHLRESLIWLLTTIAAVAVTAYPRLLADAAHALGIQVPANALFGAGLLYLAVNVLSVTIAVSGNTARLRRLAQECALLRAELTGFRARVPGGGGEPPDRRERAER